jgi:unsaturated rhamnogalacturonyl hydrolase
MCVVAERTDDDAIVAAALDLADFLGGRPRIGGGFASFARAPLREPYGGEALPAAERELLLDPGPGIFVDCLHFDPPFFAHLGVLASRRDLIDLGAEQALAYVRLLQGERGLFWHFLLERTGGRYGYAWSRGQGWALLGLLDTLTYLPAGHGARPELEASLGRLVAALTATQLVDGGWPRVVDDPDAGPESSASAFAAAGLLGGLSRGLLGPEVRDSGLAAWKHALSQVDESGLLTGVSAAVWASTSSSHYRHVPTGFDVPWGQGALLVAASRASRTRHAPGAVGYSSSGG